MQDMIEVSEDKLTELAKAAYDLSSPAGLGFLYYQEGSLTNTEAKALVDRSANDKHIALSLDYVKGRGCKLTVFREGGKLWMPKNHWFDHNSAQLSELHKRVGVTATV